MNQEELDNLIGDDFEDFEEVSSDEIADMPEESEEVIDEDIVDDDSFADVLGDDEDSKEDDEKIVPPPADSKNKVVAQLDEVTKESEEKATQILDIMDEISNNTEKNLNSLREVLEFLQKHKVLCEKLHSKFPHIKTFEKELNEINIMIEKINEAIKTNEIIYNISKKQGGL